SLDLAPRTSGPHTSAAVPSTPARRIGAPGSNRRSGGEPGEGDDVGKVLMAALAVAAAAGDEPQLRPAARPVDVIGGEGIHVESGGPADGGGGVRAVLPGERDGVAGLQRREPPEHGWTSEGVEVPQDHRRPGLTRRRA